MTPTATRRRILDAALACFLQGGYDQTTIARIRERAGASNGALFHHFATKEAIAEALDVEAIASFQEGLWKLVRSRPRSLRAAVRGTISHQLRWTEQHVDLARFLDMRGHLDFDSPGAAQVASLNRDLAAAMREWMAPFVERAEARPNSMLLISAIVAGPAHAIARRWLSGQLHGPPMAYVDELAEAACAGLGAASPPAARAARHPQPRHGRVTLELVSDDGRVLARGEATADLHPPGQAGSTHDNRRSS